MSTSSVFKRWKRKILFSREVTVTLFDSPVRRPEKSLQITQCQPSKHSAEPVCNFVFYSNFTLIYCHLYCPLQRKQYNLMGSFNQSSLEQLLIGEWNTWITVLLVETSIWSRVYVNGTRTSIRDYRDIRYPVLGASIYDIYFYINSTLTYKTQVMSWIYHWSWILTFVSCTGVFN
jgi:hypothetical protein